VTYRQLRPLSVFAWALGALCLANAQTPAASISTEAGQADGREYRLHIRPIDSTTQCEFSWHQTGSPGGYGGGSTPKRLGPGEFALRTGHDGKPASTLKISVWCRGFGVALIDEPALATSSFEQTVTLTPLRELSMGARLLTSPDFETLATAKFRVLYQADWLCSFFDLMDCGVLMWEVANGSIANDNSLQVNLPDFASDAAVRKWSGAPPLGLDAGRFLIQVSRSTAPYDYWLDPDAAKFHGIPVAAAYPPLFLRPRKQ
jgi:hypothetical protein